MAHRIPKTFAPACAVFTIAVLLGSLDCYNLSADDLSLPQGNAEVLSLRTDGLATPLFILGDLVKRPITSLEIRGELASDGDGQGTITVDESTFTFNEFGDSTVAKLKVWKPSQVTFRKVMKSEKSKKLRLYEIVFADGSFPKRMRLVLSDGTIGPHRLLIQGGENPVQDWQTQPLHILDLMGLPVIKELLPDVALRPTFNLTTLSSYHERARGGLHRLTIRGTPNGPVYLDLDPNGLGFNDFGDVESTTLMGFPHIKTELRRIEIPDPTMKDRLLFEVVADGAALKSKYFLVLSQTDVGPHRLLIREEDSIKHVLTLHDPDRRYHLDMQSQLEEIPLQERRAIADLRQTIGYRFRFKVESQCVVELSVQSGDDADRIDPTLKHLKNLRDLDFNSSPLSAVGLASLHNLTKLEHLRWSFAHIDDRGLASVKDLPQLRGLWFYCCQGITDEGMTHLVGLRNLKWLRLYRLDSLFKPDSIEKLVTDAGLENLKGLTELEYLHVAGQKITDAGLEHLSGLTNLKDVNLSGEGITDAGLEHLKGWSHLNQLDLTSTRVTPAGKAALKAKLPMLNISL